MIKPLIHNNYTISKNREVFCKKEHDILSIKDNKCSKCEYFISFLYGNGVACYWEDCVPADQLDITVPYDYKEQELLRVSKLIDNGLIKKG